jgi:hypothetical protein
LIDRRRRWGQWRVYFMREGQAMAYLPAAWTDADPLDPFVTQAQGRAIARVEDLLRLAEMVAAAVKENKPKV